MKTYVLVDFENVPLKNADFAKDETIELLIFIGKTQTKLSTDLVLAVNALGSRARYVKMDGSGKNALDFHLAYYLGKLAEKDPEAEFVVLSKDTGFDPLLAHLAANNRNARRVSSLDSLRPLVAPTRTETGGRVERAEKQLSAMSPNRPTRLKTLHSTLQDLLGRDRPLSEDELRGVVATLQTRGVLTVKGSKITYPLQT